MGEGLPERFGDWLVLDRIGKGGQGKVFLVRKFAENDAVALVEAIRDAGAMVRYGDKPSPANSIVRAL
jgi:hypothetical protein